MSDTPTPRVKDDDRGTVAVFLDGRKMRAYSYGSETERRRGMEMAREFVEGWYCRDDCAGTLQSQAG